VAGDTIEDLQDQIQDHFVDAEDDHRNNLEKSEIAEGGHAPMPTVFTKVEKSLASLGFFTPSSRRIKEQKNKRIDFTREVDGKRVGVSAEIIPSAMFGLPVTADQDKWLALQRIITDQLWSDGKLANPIRFKSADLLRLLNDSTKSGKNYKEVGEWLDVMSSTTIFSDGVVYAANKKRFARDRFRVFDRAVSVGKELDDGTIADANYVWLSAWQLENMNEKFVLPIDLEAYRELKNHISKALVPHLQIWLFASHKVGSFTKRYDELCELFALKQYRAPSLILRQLKPSLDELTQHEYLAKWQIEKTVDRKAYKITFFHGAKFHRDRRRRIERKNPAPVIIAESEISELKLPDVGNVEPPETKAATETRPEKGQTIQQGNATGKLIDELAGRGLMPSVALRLLDGSDATRLERVADQIEYWDELQKTKNVGAGLLHDFIKNDVPLPRTFEPGRVKETRRQAEAHQRNLARVEDAVDTQYVEYCRSLVDRFVSELPAGEFDRRVEERRAQTSQSLSFYSDRPDIAQQFARHEVRAEIAKTIPVLSREEFRGRELAGILVGLQIDPSEFGVSVSNDSESDALPNVVNVPTTNVPLEDGVPPIREANLKPKTA